MMASVKAILFDLDGTLRDTKDIIIEGYMHAVERHSGYRPSLEELQPYIHHHTEVHRGLSSEVDYGDWLETYRLKIEGAWRDSPFFEHAEAVLEELKMAGYRLAVVTSADYDRTIEYLSYRNVDQFFEVVVAMREGFRPKPAPDMMVEALRQLGCKPGESITVGDMVTDCQAAKAAGIPFVGITHGFASREELSAIGADYLVDSLAEIPALLTQR
ncbi:HAD family hydrolase [Candidatus Saccharibacteria bacterium]|nr:MAG: HAD family hydrolase [Candidatus Saccharibacteria bacterium]